MAYVVVSGSARRVLWCPRPTTATRSPVAEVLAHGGGSALGGQQRDGQVQMADEVAEAMAEGRHLLVQAGTGTGKSLGYLVPAMLHDKRVVVATATLALQHQLVERDLPRLVEAVKDVKGVDTSYAVLKGRSNYACLHRIRAGVPDDQGTLVDVPRRARWPQKVLELRAWAEEESEQGASGERDNAPRHTDREWRQVCGQPPRVPRRDQVPVRRGVLRRAGQARRPSAAT